MNIFFTNDDPETCAQEHCDKHAVKMNIEYPQMLSTAHRVLDGILYTELSANGRKVQRYRLSENDSLIYKAAHVNHPSSKWVRESRANYMWLYSLWSELSKEYTHRYGKTHECWRKLGSLLATPPMNISDKSFTQPPPAMKAYPQCIVPGDSIESYRNYYREAKSSFARWTNREAPTWYIKAA